MIKIIQDKDESCPVLFCDICQKRIEKWNDGEYLIPTLKDGEVGDIIMGHWDCTKAFERKQFERDGETIYGNMGLHLLFVYLVNNLQMDFENSKRNAEALSMIG